MIQTVARKQEREKELQVRAEAVGLRGVEMPLEVCGRQTCGLGVEQSEQDASHLDP